MIGKFESYHGVVLSRIVHRTDGVFIRKYSDKDNASYVINNDVGLFIKHSSKRLTPWSFTFKSEHIRLIMDMSANLQRIFVVLVCHEDGICCISYEDFILLLGENVDSSESKWIRVERNRREEYLVRGPLDQLPYKIADSHFPSKLFQ